MKDLNSLQKNLKKDLSSFKKIKVALLGDSSTRLLAQAIKGVGADAGISFDLFEAGYDQVDLQLSDTSSELYAFKPEFIIVFCSAEKLKNKFYRSAKSEKINFAETHIQWIENTGTRVSQNLNTKLIYLNFPLLNDGVFGNFANKTQLSFIYQLRKINFTLMDLSAKLKNLFICDLDILQNQLGRKEMSDPRMYVNADMVISVSALPVVAKNICDIILSAEGSFKKCLILDLDNTIWGGTIGDDGIENIHLGELGIGKAFTELQLWAKQLKERGILLAVCSKNDETTAKEPFEKHPDMVLRPDDISVFIANWNNKVDNIKHIQQILNIGFDSMVFLDDDAFERNMVRTLLPEITVPELPVDPAEYLEYLATLNLFETASFSEEDEIRAQHYKDEAKRAIDIKSHTDENSFLAGLNMVSEVKPFDKFNIPRVAQLTQRSNQFNLRTIRYTEKDIEKISHSDEYATVSFTLEDKYGSSGLIAAAILKKQADDYFFIDTWLMSCRVLKRGMENFTLNTIVKIAKEKGIKKLAGEFISTVKNSMVKDLYKDLGFTNSNGIWELAIDTYKEKPTFISEKK